MRGTERPTKWGICEFSSVYKSLGENLQFAEICQKSFPWDQLLLFSA